MVLIPWELARKLKECLLGTSLCRCMATGVLGFKNILGLLSCASVLQKSREDGGFVSTGPRNKAGWVQEGVDNIPVYSPIWPHCTCVRKDKLAFTKCYFSLQQQPKQYVIHFKIMGLLFPHGSSWKI